MGKLLQQLKRWQQRAKGLPVLQSHERQQEKFRKKYPRYALGAGTYGLPTVHDDNQGTTLRIGAYCSIASGVQIFLGNQQWRLENIKQSTISTEQIQSSSRDQQQWTSAIAP